MKAAVEAPSYERTERSAARIEHHAVEVTTIRAARRALSALRWRNGVTALLIIEASQLES